jgi:hypothetical protein
VNADATSILAVAGVALATVDLVLAVWFLVWTRRIRGAQRALLGGASVDLVEFAVGMQARQEQVERVMHETQAALTAAQSRIDRCYAHRAIVRYDAYADAGGRQSSTIALLDEHGTGLVVSAIQDRAYARVYVKEVERGKAADVALSPEEEAAIGAALERG